MVSLRQDDETLTGIAGVGGNTEAVVVSRDSQGEVGVEGRHNLVLGATLRDETGWELFLSPWILVVVVYLFFKRKDEP